MKLTFHGENLADIHNQIVEAADTIRHGLVKSKPQALPKETLTHRRELKVADGNDLIEAFKQVEVAEGISLVNTEQTQEDVIKAPNFPVPSFAELKAQAGMDLAKPESEQTIAVDPTHIDGYRISQGSVWVPVEGRSNAFSGIPMDRYLAQKAAKESGQELDSTGAPYDPAIHTSTKAKTSTGVWKKRPGGVKPATTSEPSQPATAPVFVTPPAPMAQQAVHIPTSVQAAPVTPIVPQFEQSSAPIGMAPAGHTYASFKANIQMVIVKLVNEGKIDRAYVKELADYFQVQNIWEVNTDDTKCMELYKAFIENGFITGM